MTEITPPNSPKKHDAAIPLEERMLHVWTRSPKSEPMRCSKCGGYYSDPKTPIKCPGGRLPK